MKKFFATIFVFVVFFLSGCSAEKIPVEKNSAEKVEVKTEMKIKILVGEKTFNATLENNPTTQEFIKKLPLEITMTELNGNEKYFKFAENFPTNDEKISEIHSGDLMLYNGNYLVIFYKDFPTSYRYTRLGKIENAENLSEIVGGDDIRVKFEKQYDWKSY